MRQHFATFVFFIGIIASTQTFMGAHNLFTPDRQAASTFSSIFAPVGAFLGITPSGAPATQYQSLQQGERNAQQSSRSFVEGSEAAYAQANGFPAGTYGSGAALGDGANGIPAYQTPTGIRDSVTTQAGTVSGMSATGSTNIAAASLGITGTGTPALRCIPSPTEANEPVLVFWSCNDGSDSATGEGFSTGGVAYGKARAAESATKTYVLTCSSGDTAECGVEVVQPLVALIVSPSGTVNRGASVELTWRSEHATNCILTSDTHSTFVREGITGDVRSPALYNNTTFSLLCETELGTLKRKEITVGVR